jgi:DNA processing protein
MPPTALWVRGSSPIDVALARVVAIVGDVHATPYGVQAAADLAWGLVRSGWTVLSGGDYGIAGAAHRAALAADGTTVAVLAGGLDRPYPSGHALLFDRIAESGLLLSESPPERVPDRQNYLARNRLIAAVATCTVVVEAKALPAASSVAAWTWERGRVLTAVPGPVTSERSAGCHRLVQERYARLVTSAKDVLAALDTHIELAPWGHATSKSNDPTHSDNRGESWAEQQPSPRWRA